MRVRFRIIFKDTEIVCRIMVNVALWLFGFLLESESELLLVTRQNDNHSPGTTIIHQDDSAVPSMLSLIFSFSTSLGEEFSC